MKLTTDRVASPIGDIVVVCDGANLCALDFADDAGRLSRIVAARYGRPCLVERADPLGVSSRLKAYFAGDLSALDAIPVDGGGTPFQRECWAMLRRIPPGSTISYAELARRVGRPSASRAVGHANGRNPIGIVVPCHRVVGSDGVLTGYAGGVARKRWLLAHEGARPAIRP